MAPSQPSPPSVVFCLPRMCSLRPIPTGTKELTYHNSWGFNHRRTHTDFYRLRSTLSHHGYMYYARPALRIRQLDFKRTMDRYMDVRGRCGAYRPFLSSAP